MVGLFVARLAGLALASRHNVLRVMMMKPLRWSAKNNEGKTSMLPLRDALARKESEV